MLICDNVLIQVFKDGDPVSHGERKGIFFRQITDQTGLGKIDHNGFAEYGYVRSKLSKLLSS